MLVFRSVSKRYSTGRAALKGVSFRLYEGEILAVIGESGAGKSTLLKCINGLVPFDSGEVVFDGVKIKDASSSVLKKVRSEIAMVFQNYNLVEELSVIENALHGALGKMSFLRGLFGLYSEEDKKTAFSLLDETGIGEIAFEKCRNLSGGQKQRVGISRALMQRPRLLLCDEPVSSLDYRSAVTVLELISSLVKSRKIGCIINLHQIDFAKKYADRILALKDGEVVFDGESAALSEEEIKNRIFEKKFPRSGWTE